MKDCSFVAPEIETAIVWYSGSDFPGLIAAGSSEPRGSFRLPLGCDPDHRRLADGQGCLITMTDNDELIALSRTMAELRDEEIATIERGIPPLDPTE